MYFLLTGCQNPDILRLVYLFERILDMISIIIPIGLIIFLTIDIFKSIIASNENEVSKNKKVIVTRIIYAMVIFFVPTIVSVLMGLLANSSPLNTEYKQCLKVDKSTIAAYQMLQDEEDEQKKKEREDKLKDKVIHDTSTPGHEQHYGSNDNNDNDNNNYGNNNYGSNNNYTPSGTEESGDLYQNLANKMMQIANNEVGYKEGANDSNKFGQELGMNNLPWCGIFVGWVAKKTTVNNVNLYNDVFEKEMPIDNYASATNSIYTFHQSSNLNFYYSNHYGGTYTPKKGDIIYFDWTNSWNKSIYKGMHIQPKGHVGIVESVSNGQVHTIEGNFDAGVGKGTYQLSNASIVGYGSWYK